MIPGSDVVCWGRQMRKLILGLMSVLVAVTGLVGLPEAAIEAHADSPVKLTVSPAKPVKGESFAVTGTLKSKVKRPVELQAKVGGAWKRIAKGTASSKGAFSLKASTKTSSLTVRVVAPKTKVGKTIHAKVTSASAKVTTVGQSAKFTMKSPVFVHQKVSAALTLTPARSGRPVQLQVKKSGKWVSAAKGKQDKKGRATLKVTPTTPGTFPYRAHAPAWRGAPAVSSKAVKVTIKPDDVKVSGGGKHTCAIVLGGTVKCWGNNQHGTVGDGTTEPRRTPTKVSGLSNVTSLAAGGAHNCALLAGGTVKCWGNNGHGRLGDGSDTDRTKPVDVKNLKGVRSIAAGDYHTCAVLSDGTVKCWGSDINHQLGVANAPNRQLLPTTVPGVAGVTEVAAGQGHTCALHSDGTVSCWGNNARGALGSGDHWVNWASRKVVGVSTATSIAAGGSHTCVGLSDGTAKCWGSNSLGELGDGTSEQRDLPVSVSGLKGVARVVAGGSATCALLRDGTVWCWGWGESGNGEPSNGKLETNRKPVKAASLSKVTDITAGLLHRCVVVANTTAKCWGWNGDGQLGDGTIARRWSPLTVAGLR